MEHVQIESINIYISYESEFVPGSGTPSPDAFERHGPGDEIPDSGLGT